MICFTGDAHLFATDAGTDWFRVPGVLLELDGAGEGLLSRLIASGAGDWLRLIPGAGDALRRVFIGPALETPFTVFGELEVWAEVFVLDTETFETEFLANPEKVPVLERLGDFTLSGDVTVEPGWEWVRFRGSFLEFGPGDAHRIFEDPWLGWAEDPTVAVTDNLLGVLGVFGRDWAIPVVLARLPVTRPPCRCPKIKKKCCDKRKVIISQC